MDVVDTRKQILDNVYKLDSYRKSKRTEEYDFYAERLRLGKRFVSVHLNGRTLFCPSRFAGYKENTMERHVRFTGKDGGITNNKINLVLGCKPKQNKRVEKKYQDLCKEIGINPSKILRTYWVIANDRRNGTNAVFPDEVQQSDRYREGAVKQVPLNSFERNSAARKACIEKYGDKCVVCKFDFGAFYGEIGCGFIHVHHLVPLANLKAEYEVDPIKDLRPVCPNCHAMLHQNDPPFSIERLKKLVKSV